MTVRPQPRTRPTSRTAAEPSSAASAALPGEPNRPRAFAVLLFSALIALIAGAAPAAASGAEKERASYRTEALPAGQAVASAASARTGARTISRIDFKADARFSLAALRWSSTQPVAGRMRAQRTDGSWSAWVALETEQQTPDGIVEGSDPAAASAARRRAKAVGAAGATEPIWTGPARRLVVELTGRRPKGLRVAFVDITGKLPSTTARPRASAARQGTAAAGIHPRADWDPNGECAPRGNAGLGSVQGVTVHHTAGSNTYTQAQVPAVMLAICKYHRNSNGWNDIGYNVLVDRYGGAWEGRAGGVENAVIGAHAQGFNSVSAGISMIGEYTSERPPPAQIATVARVAAWKLAVAGVPRTGTVELTSAGGSLSRYGAGRVAVLPRVFGHRDVGETACPGNTGYTVLNEIRASVAAADPSVPAIVPPVATPEPPKPVKITISTKRRLDVGASAVITGTALQGTAPLRNEALALQVGGGSTWTTVARATTDTSGKYRFARKFSRSWNMRVAQATGDGASSAVEMAVVPKLTLTVPKRLALKKRITLRGLIKPGRGPVSLTVERRAKNGTYVKGPTLPVKLKGRVMTVSITPQSLTLYRFQLVYAGSALAAPAKSPLGFGRAVPAKGAGSAGGASVD